MTAKPWVVKPLILPVGDKSYTVQPISYADGLSLIAIHAGKSEEITADTPEDVLYRLVMGDTWQQMLDDGCPYPVMFRAGFAAVYYQTALVNGADSGDAVTIGESVWESGIDPETLAATLAANSKQKPSGTSKRSTSTASGSATRSRASTKATTSQTGTRQRGSKATANRSPGAR